MLFLHHDNFLATLVGGPRITPFCLGMRMPGQRRALGRLACPVRGQWAMVPARAGCPQA